jgi:hypothetical protein
VLGFPIAIVLGWALEVTPDGIKRTEAAPQAQAVQGEQAKQEATPALLGTRTLVVAGLLVAVGIGLGAGWWLKPGEDGPQDATTGDPVTPSAAAAPGRPMPCPRPAPSLPRSAWRASRA